ncbi:agmatine deiminase family protein [Nitrospina watsonii]|uniref:N-carbamoylputrescine amidase / Agmatine deiminase n=1 Tax=Nitrospina watsonii TaxID=1323948 RepID=A0ABN8VXD4_9BACT|nr:agmatine deiminase family protein [Nitrospina watsonii]CAI2718422.1 N-carbamoylputrescine amidase / Agmatine deiminase [Nitrospina watsonii]
MTADSTPVQLGFRMPAEWEPHAATWLTWPHNPETWPELDLRHVEEVYLQMIAALLEGEKVHILANDPASRLHIEKRLKEHRVLGKDVQVHGLATNDSWIRDYGPNFLVRDNGDLRDVAANVWRFNSWGGKYPSQLDDRAGRDIARGLGVPVFEPDLILEGGAIEVNGNGTCLTTGRCLLNSNRNPEMTQDRMENHLKDHLGVSRVLWFEGDLEGDDTDGHIDNLVRFVNPTTVVYAYDANKKDPNHACLRRNQEILKSATDAQGNALEALPLPMPGRVEFDGERLPASHANFYIGNRCVLLPVFGQSSDAKAEGILKTFFPDRKIVPVACNQFVLGLGALHCVTQQQPADRI